jgi:hypothetical protein
MVAKTEPARAAYWVVWKVALMAATKAVGSVVVMVA